MIRSCSSVQFDAAQEEACERLEAEARRRAVEGVDEPRTVAGQREIVKRYSDALLIFLMKGANPEKYASQTAAQRKALANLPKVQVACPVSGKDVNAKKFVEHDGEKILFCCGGCVKKFEKDPDRYQAALANSYTYQTLCPVMEKEINPSVFMETRAGKVYFCCKMCDEKLVSNPEKYLSKLEAQGIKLTARDLQTEKRGGS